MDGLSETQGKILNKSCKLFEISSQILSKLNQDPKKLNLLEIPVMSIAVNATKTTISLV